MQVETRVEGKRGCGYRKPGGLYLVCKGEGMACCKLPFPLTVCPCCSAGIKPSRAWTWVDSGKLFDGEACTSPLQSHQTRCPLSHPQEIGRAGLIWIGEQFYPSPDHFQEEARRMGISRRISAIPRGFKLGETWVLLAHRKGIQREVDVEGGLLGSGIQLTRTEWIPAIFTVFKPNIIEYVVKGDETEEELVNMERRGITPIQVNPRRSHK